MAQQPLVDQGLHIIEASWTHPDRHTTHDRIPLAERSARRGDHYLTTHNTDKRQTSPSGSQTRDLRKRRAANPSLEDVVTGIGFWELYKNYIKVYCLGKLQNSLMLEQVVHIVTTGLFEGNYHYRSFRTLAKMSHQLSSVTSI
jgi:hypothetical protein